MQVKAGNLLQEFGSLGELRVYVPMDDDAGTELHLNITSEGVIQDLVDADGEIIATSGESFDDTYCRLYPDNGVDDRDAVTISFEVRTRFIDKLIETAADGNLWGEHPDHPREDWQHEVSSGDTIIGYWEWVACRIEEG